MRSLSSAPRHELEVKLPCTSALFGPLCPKPHSPGSLSVPRVSRRPLCGCLIPESPHTGPTELGTCGRAQAWHLTQHPANTRTALGLLCGPPPPRPRPIISVQPANPFRGASSGTRRQKGIKRRPRANGSNDTSTHGDPVDNYNVSSQEP